MLAPAARVGGLCRWRFGFVAGNEQERKQPAKFQFHGPTVFRISPRSANPGRVECDLLGPRMPRTSCWQESVTRSLDAASADTRGARSPPRCLARAAGRLLQGRTHVPSRSHNRRWAEESALGLCLPRPARGQAGVRRARSIAFPEDSAGIGAPCHNFFAPLATVGSYPKARSAE